MVADIDGHRRDEGRHHLLSGRNWEHNICTLAHTMLADELSLAKFHHAPHIEHCQPFSKNQLLLVRELPSTGAEPNVRH